jgi:dTDP-4-amino-4,6-dideoxygalactose transaminase
MMKAAAKFVVRNTVGRMPPPASRLSGQLAIFGGRPVRDVRLRPFHGTANARLSDWLSSVGPAFRGVFLSAQEGLPQRRAREFERRWAGYCGCRHALLLPHGTDALRIGIAAVFDHDGLDYGGEIIVPNLSFIASATSALDRRFGVALVDVDPDTLLLDPKCVEQAIAPGRTKAIMPVHQFGQSADMTALRAIAERHGLRIIEDAAQAHGAEWQGRRVGGLGDVGAFSFQSSKNLASGEGGVLTTNDGAVVDRARSMANAGRASEGGGRWEHPNLGWNCRPSEYQAALLLCRLDRFDDQQARRAANLERLAALIAGCRSFVPVGRDPRATWHSAYMFAMRYRQACPGIGIDRFLEAVRAEGAPVHRLYTATIAGQPIMQKLAATRPDYIRVLPTPVSDAAIGDLAYVPQEALLGTSADMADIATAIEKVERHFATVSP